MSNFKKIDIRPHSSSHLRILCVGSLPAPPPRPINNTQPNRRGQVRDLIAFKNHYDLSSPVLLADGLLPPDIADSHFFARSAAPAATARSCRLNRAAV
jgi:hypothetical protein